MAWQRMLVDLCAADDAQILRIEGDVLTRLRLICDPRHGGRPDPLHGKSRPVVRSSDRQTVHVHDIRAAEGEGFRHGAAFGYGAESHASCGAAVA